MRTKYGLVAISIMALVAGACGGGAVEAGDDGTIEITLSEFQFDPSDIVLHPGDTVTIVIDNQGEKEHEFMVGQTVRMTGGIPDGFETDFFETVSGLTVEPTDAAMGLPGMDMDEGMEGDDHSEDTMGGDDMGGDEMGDMDMGDEHGDDHGFMVMRQPTTQARVTFTVTEESIGEWDIGCFEEDGAHWDDGMQGTLVVEEA